MIDAYLRTLLDAPIGTKEIDPKGPEGKEAAKRASKIWLPEGKRSASSGEARTRRAELRQSQVDIEDAIEAAGGQRGACQR